MTISLGVVTIKSTAGLQALLLGVPVKIMGRCFYDIEGLTNQKELRDYWRNLDKPDRQKVIKFF